MTVSPTPDSPAAPDRSLAAQPAREDIANAIQACEGMAQGMAERPEDAYVRAVFVSVTRLLRLALAKLDGASGPPNTQDHT